MSNTSAIAFTDQMRDASEKISRERRAAGLPFSFALEAPCFSYRDERDTIPGAAPSLTNASLLKQSQDRRAAHMAARAATARAATDTLLRAYDGGERRVSERDGSDVWSMEKRLAEAALKANALRFIA